MGWLARLLAALLPAARGKHQQHPQEQAEAPGTDDTIILPRIRHEDDDRDSVSAPTLTLNDDDDWDYVSAAMLTRLNLPPGRVPPYLQPGDEEDATP